MTTILITGANGDVGLALGYICQVEGYTPFGVDMAVAVTPNPFVEVHRVPRADDPMYFTKLYQRAMQVQADYIVPTSDFELREFWKAGLLKVMSGFPVIAADPKSVETGLDKYHTNLALRRANLRYPATFPLFGKGILKPRFGQGGKGVVRIDANYIWQEYIDAPDQEFTCGLFSAAGHVRCIVLKRKLLPTAGAEGGRTVQVEVCDEPDIEQYLKCLAASMNLQGSINVQLRRDSGGPVAFEINPRFSSTVAVRHQLGFKDFVWSMQVAMGEPVGEYTKPKAGQILYRVDAADWESADEEEQAGESFWRKYYTEIQAQRDGQEI